MLTGFQSLHIPSSIGFILTTLSLIAQPVSGAAAGAEMDMDMGEEEAMVRAIAMSLGESLLSPEEQAEKQRLKEEEARAKKEAAEKEALEAVMKDEEPLATEVIDKFTESMLEGA